MNDTRIVKERAPTLVLRSGRATNHKSTSNDTQRPLQCCYAFNFFVSKCYDYIVMILFTFETSRWECSHEMNASVNDTRIVKERAPTLVLRSGRATNHKSSSDDAQRPLAEYFS